MRSALAIVGGLLLATRLLAAPLCGNSGPLDSSCGGGGGGGGSPGGGTGNIQINAGGGNFGAFGGISCTPGLCLDALDASGNPTCTACGGGAINCTTASSLFCLAGRAGGQTAFGGTAASDTLGLGANSTIPAGVTVQLSGLGTNRVIIGPPVDPTAVFVPPGIVDFFIVDQGFAGANLGLWGVPGGTSLFGIQSGGTALAPTATVDNSPIFSLTAIGTDATGAIFTIPEVAKFSVTAKLPSGIPQTGFVSGTVTLNSTDITGTSREHLFIDEQGRVGIQEGAPVGSPGDVTVKAKVFIGPAPSGGNDSAGVELQSQGGSHPVTLQNFSLSDTEEAALTPSEGMSHYNKDGSAPHHRFRGRLDTGWATFIMDDGAGNVVVPGNLSSGSVTASGATITSSLTVSGSFTSNLPCDLVGTPTCGASCNTVISGSGNCVGGFSVPGLATTGTINFSGTRSSQPFCTCTVVAATPVACAVTTISTTTVTFGFSGPVSGNIDYQCFNGA